MLFPDLKQASVGYVNLNLEAARWLALNRSEGEANPLLDPIAAQWFVNETHRELGLDVSYGGWLEDRRDLWDGSYLDAAQTYLHLGVDVNAPVGTRVAVDRTADVIAVDDDSPLVGGWGNRVILRLRDVQTVLIYAHLARGVRCAPGDVLSPGDVFASLGTPDENGSWFSHVHVQAIRSDFFETLSPKDLADLDGYGRADDRARLARLFPDPLRHVDL